MVRTMMSRAWYNQKATDIIWNTLFNFSVIIIDENTRPEQPTSDR